MNFNKDETEYTPMSSIDNNEQTITVDEPAYSYYIIPTHSKKKKQCGGMCCCLLMLIFFLCFFFIPRKPTVVLDKLMIAENGTSYGSFRFHNNNYFDIWWKNPDISLYWLPYNGQEVGSICYNQDHVCDSSIYVDSMCAIKLGEFEKKNTFRSESRSIKQKNIPMVDSTLQEIACTSWMILNPYQGRSQRLLTMGHVHSESEIHNFGKISIPKTFYYLS